MNIKIYQKISILLLTLGVLGFSTQASTKVSQKVQPKTNQKVKVKEKINLKDPYLGYKGTRKKMIIISSVFDVALPILFIFGSVAYYTQMFTKFDRIDVAFALGVGGSWFVYMVRREIEFCSFLPSSTNPNKASYLGRVYRATTILDYISTAAPVVSLIVFGAYRAFVIQTGKDIFDEMGNNALPFLIYFVIAYTLFSISRLFIILMTKPSKKAIKDTFKMMGGKQLDKKAQDKKKQEEEAKKKQEEEAKKKQEEEAKKKQEEEKNKRKPRRKRGKRAKN